MRTLISAALLVTLAGCGSTPASTPAAPTVAAAVSSSTAAATDSSAATDAASTIATPIGTEGSTTETPTTETPTTGAPTTTAAAPSTTVAPTTTVDPLAPAGAEFIRLRDGYLAGLTALLDIYEDDQHIVVWAKVPAMCVDQGNLERAYAAGLQAFVWPTEVQPQVDALAYTLGGVAGQRDICANTPGRWESQFPLSDDFEDAAHQFKIAEGNLRRALGLRLSD